MTDTLWLSQKGVQISHNRIPEQPYPAQFREQMIELVKTGTKPGELAKEFGCHASSIMNWMRQADEASGITLLHAGALGASERQELIELRRKVEAAPVFPGLKRFGIFPA